MHGVGGDIEGHLLVLGGQAGVGIPMERADPLGTVAHQPVDVVLPLADIEGPLQKRRAAFVRCRWRARSRAARNTPARPGRSGVYAEYHGELVSVARQFLQWDADLISGVEFQVEARVGLLGVTVQGRSLRLPATPEWPHPS